MISAIRGAQIPAADAPVDILLGGGRIREIIPATGGPGIDVGGRAVLPGLVDAHIHLDKAYQLDALAVVGADGALRNVADAISATAAVNRVITTGERIAAAKRLLGRMVRHGTMAARVHVEIDGTDAGNLDWQLDLAAEWRDRISLQLVAFPQLGLFHRPGVVDALHHALRNGCTVIGGCPYADDDRAGHIAQVFELAAAHRCGVDFHIDFTDDPGVADMDSVMDLMADRSAWHGRVAAGHVTSLAFAEPAVRAARVARMASLGVGVITLPATDLYLGGAVAPLPTLSDAGVVVAIGTNNVGNAFTPYGDGSLLQVAWLAGLVNHLGPGDGHRLLLDAVTVGPARLLGLTDYGIRPGAWADLVVVDASRAELAVAAPAEVVLTVRHGTATWSSL